MREQLRLEKLDVVIKGYFSFSTNSLTSFSLFLFTIPFSIAVFLFAVLEAQVPRFTFFYRRES